MKDGPLQGQVAHVLVEQDELQLVRAVRLTVEWSVLQQLRTAFRLAAKAATGAHRAAVGAARLTAEWV